MNAGQLNHLFDICDHDDAQEADGDPQPALKPKVVWQGVWGNLATIESSSFRRLEEKRGNQMTATSDWIVTIRYREGVKPTHFLLERGTNRQFNIVKASDESGMRTWLSIYCKEAT